jgi:hypothetical protein
VIEMARSSHLANKATEIFNKRGGAEAAEGPERDRARLRRRAAKPASQHWRGYWPTSAQFPAVALLLPARVNARDPR